MLRNWLIIIAFPFFFQIVFLIILFRSQAARSEAQAWAIHTVDVIAQAESINGMLNEARGDVLGRLVTGDRTKGRLQDIEKEIDAQFKEIQVQVEDNPKNLTVINDAAATAQQFLTTMDIGDRFAREGRRDEFVNGFQNSARPDSLLEIRKRLDVFLAGERKLYRLRMYSLDQVVAIQNRILICGTAFTVGMVAVLVIIFTSGFIRRMALLASNARRLAEGESLLEPLKGNDEIAHLDKVFRAMAKSLAERDQENEMFIFSVSHDLRSPLVNLQGFSRELALSAGDLKQALGTVEVPPDVRTKLDRIIDRDMKDSIYFIQNAVVRLAAIIDSLLRLSRVGRVLFHMEYLEMNKLVRRVVESQMVSTKEKGATIEVEDLPPAWGDVTAVEQIFSNLLTNAVKYLDPERPGRIKVGVAKSGGDTGVSVTYYVMDNGLGIPAAHQAKLFTAFQRLHPNVAEGQGVGLALVRRMVERHSGKIWAESEAGMGTTFFVTLTKPSEKTKPGSDSRDRLQIKEPYPLNAGVEL